MDSDATHAKESKFCIMCKSKLDLVIEKNRRKVIFIKGYCTTAFKCTTTAKLYSNGSTTRFHSKSKFSFSTRSILCSRFGGVGEAAVRKCSLK